MIPLEQIREMFAKMRRETHWDVDGKLVWGYFFTDPERTKLEEIWRNLSRHGYRLVRIFQTDDKKTQCLHIEKLEQHTPETLHARNSEFERLAEDFRLESYDGMDVGPLQEKD